MLPSEKRVAIVEIGKIRSPNNMMELNLITKVFPSIQVWKIFEKPTRKKTSLKENSQQQQKIKNSNGLIGSSILNRIFVRFWMFNDFRTKPRSALRVLPALRFLRVRLCRDQGQRCQDLLDQRRLGLMGWWWRGENLNFPWWWEHPPVTKWIF